MENFIRTAALMLALAVAVGACGSDPDGPAWIDGGTHVARVYDIVVPDSISHSDTLRVRLSATLNQPIGQPEFSHIETVWTANVFRLTVWANVDLWAGGGVMPPTSLTVLHDYEHEVLPPFPPGQFEVLITQLGGAASSDTVYMKIE